MPIAAARRLALVLGENELERGVAALKPLRLEAAEQAECTLAELAGAHSGHTEHDEGVATRGSAF